PPVAISSPIVGYGWEAGRTKQVVYLTEDGHIHELFFPVGGSWTHADLTQITGAPPVAINSWIVVYAWEAGRTKQVVYLTADRHIHELFVPEAGSWTHVDPDLTDRTGAPLILPDRPIILP